MEVKKVIIESLAKATGLEAEDIHLETAEKDEFGDYASNVALQLFEKIKNRKSLRRQSYGVWVTKIKDKYQNSKTSRELAEVIVGDLKKDKTLLKIVDKIEVAGPGFINFWLTRSDLASSLQDVIEEGESYGKSDFLKGKKYLIEHTSPNTIKTLHVGHVRNNVLGMAIHNILEFAGADVKLDAINNDRGIHVMKAVWAYMKYGNGTEPGKEKSDHFVDRFYVMGVKAYEDDEKAKEEIKELLRKWEAEDKQVRSLWKKLRDWTFEGFRQTYKRLGSHHDRQWFESDFYKKGKEMVEEGLKKGVFRRLEDGAVLSNLKDYGLPDTIILRADGTSMYHTQDLYLTKLKRETFPSDLYIWDIGPEQELYLRQLFAMCEQLGIGKREDFMHLSYGFVYLKGKGKMSSRAGNVISADDLLNEIVGKAKKIIESSETGRGMSEDEKDQVSEAVGLAAIRYGFLKVARTTDIYFNIDESLSLEGNSGPYLQYTYVRTQSVLRNAQLKNKKTEELKNNFAIKKYNNLNTEELLLLRCFVHFPEVIVDAAKNYSPNLLCNYLYDLAQKFNTFYNAHRIVGSDSEEFRLMLTTATGQILKNGLNLLGIEAPERM